FTTVRLRNNMALAMKARDQSSDQREDQQMNKIKSGGGLTSNKLVRPDIRTGSPAKGTSPERAAQIGASTFFQKEKLESHPAYTGTKLGNEIALNVGAGGPGKGRTTYHCGSQSLHGKPDPGEGVTKGSADVGPRSILNEKGS